MKIKKAQGQSIIEFALIFPIIFFLITGFFDLGRAVIYYTSLSHAVREVTRAAIVDNAALEAARTTPCCNPLVAMVKEKAIGLRGDYFTSIIIDPEPDSGSFETVLVSAEYSFDPVTPGIELLLGGEDGIILKAQSKMWVAPGSK